MSIITSIVGYDTGKILYQNKDNTVTTTIKKQSEIVSDNRRYNHILRWLHENKDELGIELTIDVKNSFEELTSNYEESVLFTDKFFAISMNGTSLNVNGETFSKPIKIDNTYDFEISDFSIDKAVTFKGNMEIILEYSLDNNKWFKYDSVTFEQTSDTNYMSIKDIHNKYKLSSTKRIETLNNIVYFRLKFTGNGVFSFSTASPISISGYGNKIISESYVNKTDEEEGIFVKESTKSSLIFSRKLSHLEDFYSENPFLKRNQKQVISINLMLSGGIKYQFIKETYTDHFSDQILLKDPEESMFFIFKNDEVTVPTISVPSQVKQLLYKNYNGKNYINKKEINTDTSFSVFGYVVKDGIKLLNSNCEEQDKIIKENLNKIKFNTKTKTEWNKLNIYDPIISNVIDSAGLLISEGKIYLDESNKENIDNIINLIKTKKTFYKMTAILYSQFDNTIEHLIKSLSAGNETPQTVFLVCSNPNDSNIENCTFDKTELGQNSFRSQLIKATKNRVGLQFNNIDDVLNKISDYVNECMEKETKLSTANAVGINFYNFTNADINEGHYNKYGYYVSRNIKNYTPDESITPYGISTSNTIEDVIQYDIGTKMDVEFDISSTISDQITNEIFKEDNDTSISMSLTHHDNIYWKYVVGIEEIQISENSKNDNRYTVGINDGKVRVKSNYNFSTEDRGDHNLTLLIKDKNGIITSFVFDFIVDYPEPVVTGFTLSTSDKVNEVGYVGKTEIEYSKENFLEVGLNLEANYEFLNNEYKLIIENKNDPEYKIERLLSGTYNSKIFNFHIDDIKNSKELNKKLKFGEWICKLYRIKRDHISKITKHKIENNILEAVDFNALPVSPDFEDFENNGLQQGKDVYIKLKFSNSEYFTKIRDMIYFCKEVKFIVNNENFTKEVGNFTYLKQNSLDSVTGHISELLDERTEMRWLISGSSESASNEYLRPIANLEGNEKKIKNIKIQLITFDDVLYETPTVKIGQTGKVKGPIILGSEEHREKLLAITAKENSTQIDKLTPEQIKEVNKKLEELGKNNYANQQIINGNKMFVFYSDLAEIQFDFGICEYYTISQANNVTDLIPITRDGKVRYVLDDRGIDENSKGILTVKGYVKLADGKTISSEEVSITLYRKKFPSLINTGDDYTRYVLYKHEKDENYYKLQTVIQSKIVLDDLDKTYSSEWMSHIEVELVDIDKRTVIVSGPPVRFYNGFIPQRFVFDSGITDEVLNSLDEDDRLGIEQAVNYIEIEKILNKEIFSKDKHLGQTFYLRIRGVETAKNIKGENLKIYGKESFYPINFDEALKELIITPANGVIVVNNNDGENYYTYKNKVNFVLESNNAEYYMYRTDRSAAFQKVYPKQIGYSKIVKLVMSTYDIGNHVLEVKQKAIGETESNVYSVIVEKIEVPTQPKITGDDVIDQNPSWTIYPVDSAAKYKTSIITDEVESSVKIIDRLQYEMEISPDNYLQNGYHIFTAKSIDKIGNESDTTYFITRKIGRPVASKILGEQKTSEEFIKWEWQSQYYEGVREYEVEINGIEKNTIPASMDGFNEYYLRYFQGKEISDGTYEIRLWAINELGNRNYVYSSFITSKGTKIKELACSFYKYKEDYTNKLEAKILTDDKAIKTIEYEIFKNNNGNIEPCTGVMSSNQKQLPFLKSDGNRVELEDGTYYFAFRGVNYIDEKTEYIRIPFIYKTTLPEKPFIYYQKSVKTANPIIFVKETGNEMIEAIEIKIGEHAYEKVRNNAWRPNYSLARGINNIVFRITDYAGNKSEYSDFIEVTSSGVNLFQEDYMANMNNPVVKLDFNLPQMSNFGHTNFRIEQVNLGIDAIIDIKNANTIEIPLTSSGNEIFPDGIYTFSIKLFDSLTNGYDYIADYFKITIDSNKPLKPYFLNNGYDNIEFNKNYTKNKSPKWIWQTKDISNLKEYIVDLYVLDSKDNAYIEYGNGQFNNYSTQLVGQFQSPDEFKDGTYKLSVKAIGKNGLESDQEIFVFVIKNSLPKPPHFDVTKMINRKYENKNVGVSWIWEDLNTGNDVIVAYKIKINDEDFSDDIDGKITHYEETRTLPDGSNKITVIGRDKAGNWSSANEVSANQLGNNYLYNVKIIDTKIPNNITEEDIKVKILNSNSFEVFFQNDEKDDEYFMFELFALDQSEDEIMFVQGNTLPIGTKDIYFKEEEVIPGIKLGALEGNSGYCEIKNNTTQNDNKVDESLYFTNLPNNVYYLRIYGIDYSGNISQPLVKQIEIQDLTKLAPKFISPTEFYTNNSTIVFQWILNKENIKNWEYQLVTPYNNSSVDLTSETKWKSISTNSFVLNNIPKIVGGQEADGDYTIYVRAVFDEIIVQEGTGKNVYKKSDVGSVTVNLDRKLPQGIIFTNKTYTTDPSVLTWTWNYTGDGDTAAGVYLSFNPNLPLEEWEVINAETKFSSFKERTDGIYTIYAKTFDKAGNINETIFHNSITLDRIPPFKPVINGGTHLFVNTIPTIQWEIDNNYFKFAWVILTLEEFNEFKEVYNNMINVENYTLKNDDWAYIFSNNESLYNEELIHNGLKELSFRFRKNDALSINEITVNSGNNKNGISEEGEYVFLLSGYDQNYNWAEEFEYQFITYDITAPNLSLIKFTSPQYTITDNRRPKWEWTVPYDVVRCKYSLEKNGYDDGSISGTLTKTNIKDIISRTYSFTPEYNLTKGNYRLIVDCFDSSGNSVQISKSVIIEDSSSELESQFFDIILPGTNNILRCKMNKYSNVYVIIDSTIDKNSVFTYKKSKDKKEGFKVYSFGKDELDIFEEYEFNITSYSLKTN